MTVLPISLFFRVDSDRDVIANLDKAKLDSGPGFSDKRVKDLANRDQQNEVCTHWAGARCSHYM
ncbi:hypothetical protein SBDP1_1590016 [Syntrophobacter sp. SbD1]|nr:hypothetical protein SBDP1_1590016 [Syntrophobacter sp. SbD1]